MWDEKLYKLNTSVYYFYVYTVHFVQFIFQTNKNTICVHNILHVKTTPT